MRSLGQRVLELVVKKLGGVEETAAQLGVSPTLIQRFLRGEIMLPDPILLKAVDLLPESDLRKDETKK